MALRSTSLDPRQSPRRYASDLNDAVVLPPLFQSSKARSNLLGLRQMKLPGGADTWTVPEVHLGGSRPPRFREFVAKTGLDFERDAAAWDVSREVKRSRPKFQTAFATSARASVASSRRSRSAVSNIRAAYGLATTAEEGSVCDLESVAGASATATSEGESFRLKHELAQITTGDDAVRFFARNSGNSSVKVLYCNRSPPEEDNGNSACSLVVVTEHNVKPEHFTISANGVFHVCPGEMSECTPLSEWMQHGMVHSVLKSLPFFKMFAYQKNFAHWRANARYEGFCRQRQRLSRSCFLAKPLFVAALANLQRLVNDIEKLPLLLLTQEPHRLQDFVDSQQGVRFNTASGTRAQLEKKHDLLLEVLSGLIASVHQAFSEVPSSQHQGSCRTGSKSKSMALQKEEAREEAKRQQTAERDLASVGNFVRLADYMFQGARVSCVMDAAVSFSKRLVSGNRMFAVDAHFEQAGVVLSPSREDFSQELGRLWDSALQAMSTLPSLKSAYQVKNYVPLNQTAGHTVEELLSKSGLYQKEVNHIENTILEQLGAAEVSANEQYMRYHSIYKFGNEWNADAFAKGAQTLEGLSTQIRYMSELKEELKGFRLHRPSGIFMVHGAGLRAILEPIPEQGLAVMMRLSASIAHDKCILTSQQILTATKALDERPTTPESIKTYQVVCDTVEAQLLASEAVVDDLESTWRLLAKQGYRIAVEDQLQFDMLQKKRRNLDEVKLPQAKAYLANLPPAPAEPDIVVTVHASPRGEHDWSLTCMGIGGDELATLRMDLQEEVLGGFKDALAGRLGVPSQRLQLVQADGQLLVDSVASAGGGAQAVANQSMAALLGAKGSRPSVCKDNSPADAREDSPT